MNTPNNKRRKESRNKITKAFFEMLQDSDLERISVTKLCKRAGVNRTTFYACYEDIYDLARQALTESEREVENLLDAKRVPGASRQEWLTLLRHIYENQEFYKSCFKLGIDSLSVQRYNIHYDTEYVEKYFGNEYSEYHMAFFQAGFNAILKMWLNGGCKETPEEIQQILASEYSGRQGIEE